MEYRKITEKEQEQIVKEVHKWIIPVGKVAEITFEGENLNAFILEIYCKGRKEMIEKRFTDCNKSKESPKC